MPAAAEEAAPPPTETVQDAAEPSALPAQSEMEKVEQVESPPESSPTEKICPGDVCTLIEDFVAEHEVELSCSKGARVEVLPEGESGGWTKVKDEKGSEGLVPSGFLMKVSIERSSEETPPKTPPKTEEKKEEASLPAQPTDIATPAPPPLDTTLETSHDALTEATTTPKSSPQERKKKKKKPKPPPTSPMAKEEGRLLGVRPLRSRDKHQRRAYPVLDEVIAGFHARVTPCIEKSGCVKSMRNHADHASDWLEDCKSRSMEHFRTAVTGKPPEDIPVSEKALRMHRQLIRAKTTGQLGIGRVKESLVKAKSLWAKKGEESELEMFGELKDLPMPWDCLVCKHHNEALAEKCARCKRPKPEENSALDALTEEENEVRDELMKAAEEDDVPRIKLIMSERPQVPYLPVDVRNILGETAALVAAMNGKARSCAYLLDLGADPLTRDSSPKYFADGSGLWADDKRPDKYGTFRRPNLEAVTGRSLVYHLRLQGCFHQVLTTVFPATRNRIVNEVVSAFQTHYQEDSPLVVAARFGYSELIAMMLTHVSAIPRTLAAFAPSTEPPTLGVTTVTTLAISSTGQSSLPSVRPNTSSSTGDLGRSTRSGGGEMFGLRSQRAEALLVAVECKKWKVAEVLLAAGVTRCSIDTARDKHGRNALHLAVISGEEKIVKMMLEAGASVFVISRFGRRPIHDACAAGHMGTASMLVSFGADVYARVGDEFERVAKPYSVQDKGKTALELAADNGFGHVFDRWLPREGSRKISSRGSSRSSSKTSFPPIAVK